MKLTCESCHAPIPPDDVNVKSDVVFCRACNSAFSLSAALNEGTVSEPSIVDPPRGAWLHSTPKETVIGATTRSKTAVFLLPFTLVWSGGSLGGIYGTQIVGGEFNLIFSLFGLPFLIGSFFLIGMCLMTLFGKVEVILDYRGDRIFSGIGKLGWTKKFNLADVESIGEEFTYANNPNGNNMCIVLAGKRRVKFAGMVSDERRYFMVNALRNAHRARKHR